MNERDFWLMVRRALLMIVKAIEMRYLQKDTKDAGASSNVILQREVPIASE